jgi:hypothetical protein
MMLWSSHPHCSFFLCCHIGNSPKVTFHLDYPMCFGLPSVWNLRILLKSQGQCSGIWGCPQILFPKLPQFRKGLAFFFFLSWMALSSSRGDLSKYPLQFLLECIERSMWKVFEFHFMSYLCSILTKHVRCKPIKWGKSARVNHCPFSSKWMMWMMCEIAMIRISRNWYMGGFL